MSDPTLGLPVPQVVSDTLIARITARSAFMGSPMGPVSAGVEILTTPFGGNFAQRNKWKEDTTRAESIDGTASTPAILGIDGELAPILRRKRVRKAFDGVDAALGLLSQDPNAATIEQTAAYWAAEIDAAVISMLKGVFDASAGICRSTHRRRIGNTTGALVPLTYAQLVRTGGLLGDNALDLASITVHGAQWSDLLLERGNATSFLPLDGSAPVPYVNGMRVIVSDSVPIDTANDNDLYTAFLVRPGAIWVQIQQAMKELVAPKPEDPSIVVSQSLHFAVGLAGVKWNVTDINPPNADLETANHWAKTTANVKDIGVLAVESNITA